MMRGDEWWNSSPRFASTPERRNENKYFTSSSGDRTHNQSVLQSHFVPLRHDWPHYNIYVQILMYRNNRQGIIINK